MRLHLFGVVNTQLTVQGPETVWFLTGRTMAAVLLIKFPDAVLAHSSACSCRATKDVLPSWREATFISSKSRTRCGAPPSPMPLLESSSSFRESQQFTNTWRICNDSWIQDFRIDHDVRAGEKSRKLQCSVQRFDSGLGACRKLQDTGLKCTRFCLSS